MGLVEQITQLISQPYGSMFYHMLISFILISILHPALGFSLSDRSVKGKRMLLGLGALIAARLVLFALSGLFAQGYETLGLILPIIDRVANAFSLIAIAWLWTFQEPQRGGDYGAVLISIFVILAGIASSLFWVSGGQTNTFNSTGLALAWSLMTMALAIGGQILIYTMAEDRNLGLFLFFIIFSGEMFQIFYAGSANSDFAFITRLTYLVAMPLMLGLARRLQPQPQPLIVEQIVPAEESEPDQDAEDIVPPFVDLTEGSEVRERMTEPITKGLDIKLYQTTLALATVSDPQEVCQLLTMYTAHAVVADICLMLTPPDDNDQVHMICGYDLIVEESLASSSFDHHIIPGYVNLIEKGRPLQIPTETSGNLRLLAELLYLDNLGNFLAYPITNEDGKVLTVMVFITPYSKYVWTADDQIYLEKSSPIIAQLLQRAWFGGQDTNIVSSLTDQLKDEQQEKERLAGENEALSAELAILSAQGIGFNGGDGDEETLLSKFESAQGTIAMLQADNQDLKENLESLKQLNEELSNPHSSGEHDQDELIETLEQVTRLQNELRVANQKMREAEDHAQMNGDTLPSEQADVIASIAQELRQPMSSISGYTDLLISESVGILGALQKKFLERVKASTDRMNHLISDLIQITTLDSGNLAITPQAFELNDIIDQAVELTSAQFREKNIILRVDISNNLPKMNTDKDALQQIVHHLMQNAGAATAMEGEIFLRAEISDKSDQDIVHVQVTDSGAGIPKEDLPRVFSRLYRADNPLIEGVGDTGVGLSIANTLTEALGGRIWVESEVGVGSTFSAAYPSPQKLLMLKGSN